MNIVRFMNALKNKSIYLHITICVRTHAHTNTYIRTCIQTYKHAHMHEHVHVLFYRREQEKRDRLRRGRDTKEID